MDEADGEEVAGLVRAIDDGGAALRRRQQPVPLRAHEWGVRHHPGELLGQFPSQGPRCERQPGPNVLTNPHALGYAQDITLATEGEIRAEEIRALFEEAQILIHSGDGNYRAWLEMERYGLRTEGKVLATLHAGSAYRAEHARFDAIDRELGFSLRLMSPDLLRFCADDPTVRPALGVAPVGSAPDPTKPPVICHSPSKRATKGTALIESVVTSLPHVRRGEVQWRLVEGVSHAECMEAKKDAAIFIDQVVPSIGGFGVSALEAMGNGAACLASQNHLSPRLEKFWPRPPIVDVRDGAELRNVLVSMLDDPERLHARRVASHAWARAHASAAACAARFDSWFDEIIESAPPQRHRALFHPGSDPIVTCGVIARVSDPFELASLTAALRSVENVADDCVVVLDDRSMEAADDALESLGAKVTRRTWTDDFAAARNAVHDLCRGDWILVIDSDELMVDEGNLPAALARARDTDADAVTVDVQTFDDRGADQVLRQPRLYRRSRGRWRFPVHNELTGLQKLVASTGRIDASYTGALKAKVARSLPVLLAKADEEPNEPRWAHFLARTYLASMDFDESIRWAEQCLDLAPANPANAQTWVDLILIRLARGESGEDSPLSTTLRALAHQPNHPDLWHSLAVVALARWFQLAPSAHGFASNRSARYATNLAAVAPMLGLPLSFGKPSGRSDAPTNSEERPPVEGRSSATNQRREPCQDR